jgi:hypothetical protein
MSRDIDGPDDYRAKYFLGEELFALFTGLVVGT